MNTNTNTNTNTAPAPSPEPMRLLFLEAMEWGRFFWAQRSVPDITLREVSQDFADKAALSAAGWVMVSTEMLTRWKGEVNTTAACSLKADRYRVGARLKQEIADVIAATPKATKATKAEPVQPERVPLSDRQISDAYFEALGSQHLREQDRKMVTRFARAIEQAHGIQPAHKEQPNG